MNLHEHQAKALLRDYGVPIPQGGIAKSAEEAVALAGDLGGSSWAVKAQIHAGLRQKAGGVRLASSGDEVRAAAGELLGSRLVTAQTGPEGKVVKSVYVEQGIGYGRELYLAALVDRSKGRVAIIAAKQGGEDIEARMAAEPDRLLRVVVDPDAGIDAEAVAQLVERLALKGDEPKQVVDIIKATYKAFVDFDASLIEFNPLVVDNAGQLRALDVKMVLDDNALFRHQDLEALRDEDEVDPSELSAKRFELNYVKLSGDIGVMVNGAGLALATVDILKQHGGEPADFMDIRPAATREQVASGFELLLDNPRIKAILVNIYGGGILRCDTVAEGIAAASRKSGLKVPMVVRLAGTNCEVARKVLVGQGIPVTFAENMADAAAKVVRASNQGMA